MITTHYEELLESAISEVLESMCFLSVDANAATDEEESSPWIRRRLHFRGSKWGSFGICVPITTARIIASNLLGLEQSDVSDSQSSEAVGEIANMICGTLLSRVDSARAFDLTSPECDDNFSEQRMIEERATKTFVLDEGMITAWIAVKPA